ncbi:MAG TPA: hypothetical protein VFC00_04115 [Micromonosporaceae bacterium]|nr:hypothetical protein [Micromonosporaceae bacterium]
MATEWIISAAAERVDLDVRNEGTTSFTVTNPGPASDRVVFVPVAGDGADSSWFSIDRPQRVVDGGASVSYLARITVPAGTPAGSYWLQGRVYSADTEPSEGSRLSGRIAFDVRPSDKPKRPLWPYAIAASLVLIVFAVVGLLVFGGGGDDTPTEEQQEHNSLLDHPIPHISIPDDQTNPDVRPIPHIDIPIAQKPIRSGTFTLDRSQYVNLETGNVADGEKGDIAYVWGFAAPDESLAVQGKAKAAYLGVVADPSLSTCSSAKLSTKLVPIEKLEAGGLLCVSTNTGRMAVVTVVDPDLKFPDDGVRLRFDLYATQ